MTAHSERARQIAATLTKAQRKCALDPMLRGGWSTLTALRKLGVVAQRQCFPDGKGITLTPLGEAVRQILQESPQP